MSGMDFTIFCGRCFLVITPQRGGSVLSCGDFLCSSCAQQLGPGSSCPACGRGGIRAAFLNDNLPEEVKANITDPIKYLENIHQVLGFQSRYYKSIIKKVITRLQESEQEISRKNSCIRDLEAKLASMQQQRQQSSFFISKDSTVPSPITVDDNFLAQRNQGQGHSHESPFFNQVGTNVNMDNGRSSYFDSHPMETRNIHQSSPRMNRSRVQDIAPISNFPQMQTSPEYDLPRENSRIIDADSVPNQFVPSSNMYFQPPQQTEDIHQERKRVFTPSRTVFSTAQQRGGITSPKVRSMNEPFVSTPTQPAFNPLKTGRVIEMYRVNNHQQTETRTSFSPMSSFLRNSSFKS